MNQGDAAALQPLRRLDVEIEGDWCPGRVRRWRGVARAEESLVGVALVSSGEVSQWCKSERASASGQSVELLLGHHDAAGLDVQVNFSVGRGQAVSRCIVPSAEFRPVLLHVARATTGVFVRLATIPSAPEVIISVVLIGGSDVKVGRNGLWHLRRHLAPSLPEPLRSILSYGRAGQVAAQPGAAPDGRRAGRG